MKNRLINLIAGRLFRLVTEEDFLRLDVGTGKVYLRGRELAPSQVDDLAREARDIQSTNVYKLILSEMTFEANKKIFFDSRSESDLVAGKMVLWTLDVLSRKVDNLGKVKGR